MKKSLVSVNSLYLHTKKKKKKKNQPTSLISVSLFMWTLKKKMTHKFVFLWACLPAHWKDTQNKHSDPQVCVGLCSEENGTQAGYFELVSPVQWGKWFNSLAFCFLPVRWRKSVKVGFLWVTVSLVICVRKEQTETSNIVCNWQLG